MPATLYKVWAIAGPVGAGVMNSLHVGVAGVAKAATADQPYAVAAELICGQLARVLLLPVPPGFIIENGGIKYHVSLNFNLAGHGLPPANAAAIVANHPETSWGIVLFDAWIINDDRHRGNIAYDQVSNKVQIFDHSHALLRGADVQDHLQNQANVLGIGGIGRQCLSPHITTAAGFTDFVGRIASVPDYYIRGIVKAAVDVGLPANREDTVANFLIARKTALHALVNANRAFFPALPPAVVL